MRTTNCVLVLTGTMIGCGGGEEKHYAWWGCECENASSPLNVCARDNGADIGEVAIECGYGPCKCGGGYYGEPCDPDVDAICEVATVWWTSECILECEQGGGDYTGIVLRPRLCERRDLDPASNPLSYYLDADPCYQFHPACHGAPSWCDCSYSRTDEVCYEWRTLDYPEPNTCEYIAGDEGTLCAGPNSSPSPLGTWCCFFDDCTEEGAFGCEPL